jgi:hypothetical protein
MFRREEKKGFYCDPLLSVMGNGQKTCRIFDIDSGPSGKTRKKEKMPCRNYFGSYDDTHVGTAPAALAASRLQWCLALREHGEISRNAMPEHRNTPRTQQGERDLRKG